MKTRFTDREGVHCAMPTQASAEDAEIYQALRHTHCVAGEPGHQCQGRLIIDKNGITASCPRCGDARQLFPPAGDG